MDTDRTEAGSPGWMCAVVLAAVLFGAVAPTLPRLEFASGGENLVVATALETRRTGNWLFPTLNSEPRVAKPPLATWLAAMFVPQATMEGLSSRDAEARARARAALAWQARWPSLLVACLMALAVFGLARTLTDAPTAWLGILVFAGNLMLLRAARAATTDILLAAWVAAANLCIALAIFRRQWWLGCCGAGVAIGFAMMSKGPVTLIQTLLPAVVFLGWSRWAGGPPSPPTPRPRRWTAVSAGVLLALLVGLPWYALVLANQPEIIDRWKVEVLREGATGMAPGKWYNYIAFVPLLAPWCVFLVVGVLIIAPQLFRRATAHRGAVHALLLVLVPIVAMSFFRDRKERYLLPMAAPAAIVAAVALREFRRRIEARKMDVAVEALHWSILGAIAVGLPIAGIVALKTVDGRPWYPTGPGFAVAAAALVVFGAAVLWARTNARRLTLATTAIMLLIQVWFIEGYRNTREGRSEMKPLADLVWQTTPAAEIFTSGQKRQAPVDLAIYLNRPVVWVEALPVTTDRPSVLVVRQDEDDPAGPEAPPGWAALGKTARDSHWWHAFASPAREN